MTGSWRAGWPALVVSSLARLVLGAVALLVAVSVVLPLVTAWQSSVVMSGSMAPTLQPGDVVVVRPVPAAELQPGDVVLVDDPDLPGQLRMHRIVAVGDGGLRLRGDAAPAADTSLVPPAAVHGVGALRLPGLGLPALWAREGDTVPLVLTGAGLVALLALAVAHRGEDEEPRRHRRSSARPIALGAAAVLLVGLPGTADARAVFSAKAGTAANSLSAAPYWTCAGAASGAGATQYYPMQETSGPVAANSGGLAGATGTYSSTGITYGVAGPECSTAVRSAVVLDGASGQMWTNAAVANPQSFSVQIWFATTTNRGGKLIGFGTGSSGASSGQFDRHIYMTDTGQLVFGVYDGATEVITSPGSYNDGHWHLVTATFAPAPGMRLYVDGAPVAKNISVSTAENYTGYWRVGYDNLANWPNAPTSSWFAGAVAHAAVFPAVLSASDVADQYTVGSWTCATAASTSGAGAVQYYGLQETAGPTAANGGSAGSAGNGTFSAGGITYDVAGPACGPGGSQAIRLDGSSGYMWSTRQVTAPQNFTVQIWFATTTTRGGKLIGFGTGANGAQSTQFDRHIYMTNGGQLAFGVYNGGYYTVTSSTAYNDGRWHLATATFSPGTGLAFYVDGTLIGTNTSTTAAENSTGYWRVGFDSLGSWPNVPTSSYFAGSVAHAMVVDRPLTADEIAGQYTAGR